MELLYLRKSRADGEHESISEVLARHEHILQEHALKTYGHTIAEAQIFREVGSGETIQARPAMCRLLETLQSDDVDAVLVVDPQRLSRGDLRDCGTVIRAFQYTQTLVVTPQHSYDLTEKYDRKFLEMELMRGNDYLEYVKEIMQRGRMASVAEGNYIGSTPPFGYDKVRIGKYCTLTENAESDAVRLIFALYAEEQLGYAAICKRLDALGIHPRKTQVWTPSSIREILQNPVYIGKIRWNCRKTVKQYRSGEIVRIRPKAPEEHWILTDGKHPPLIGEALFQKAQARIGAVPRVQKARTLCNPFAGLCRCTCGAAMVIKPCSRARDRILCRNQTHCRNRSAVFPAYESAVFEALRHCLPDLETSYSEAPKLYAALQSHLLEAARNELQALEKQQESLYNLLERGIYTEEVYVRRNAELSERRKAAQAALQQADALQTEPAAVPARCITLSEVLTAVSGAELPVEMRNAFLKAVIEEITYTGGTEDTPFSLQITLRF